MLKTEHRNKKYAIGQGESGCERRVGGGGSSGAFTSHGLRKRERRRKKEKKRTGGGQLSFRAFVLGETFFAGYI